MHAMSVFPGIRALRVANMLSASSNPNSAVCV